MNFIDAVKSAKEGKRVYRILRPLEIKCYLKVENDTVSAGISDDILECDVLSEDWEVEG